MDTKLKKTHRIATFLITLCILIPAFLIISLYPQISSSMKKSKEESFREYQEEYGSGPIWDVDSQFLNYAMEASYYVYGGLLEEVTREKVNYDVLAEYGWVEDYYYVIEEFAYQAKYTHDGHTTGTGDDDFGDADDIGYLTFRFNKNGRLSSDIEIDGVGNNNINIIDSTYDLQSVALRSEKQYEQNVLAYENANQVDVDEEQVKPKNFEITFALRQDGLGLIVDRDMFYTSTESLLFDVGVLWIMLAGILFVALIALILPFWKKLSTGWEKLFCIPFEIVVLLAGGAIGAFVGMFYAMGETCMLMEYPEIQIIGAVVSKRIQYIVLLMLNFLGWSICFFIEYVVITSIRQLLCRPVYYIRNRLLVYQVFRLVKRQCVKLYHWIIKLEMDGQWSKAARKIAIANFGVLVIFLVIMGLLNEWMWWPHYFWGAFLIGIIVFAIYAALLYVLLVKWGNQLQRQYRSILQATSQMAEGNLKISLEEDLGVFGPIGDSLREVQQGFKQAVIEEAKSQSMKTELITNVSHDLKTPLTAIITYVNLLKKEDITEEERKSYIETLDKKSQRLKVLIEDLFEVSKAQSGNVQMNFMDVDIVSLMKQVRSEMEDQIEDANLAFRWNLPDEKLILSLDGQRTYRVFENLLNNVLKYAMPYSRVYVDMLCDAQTVKVTFRNVSAQELNFDAERLTERFVRGDASRQSEGSGLGLAIAKSFVELQDGTFEIEVDGDLFKVILTWKVK